MRPSFGQLNCSFQEHGDGTGRGDSNGNRRLRILEIKISGSDILADASGIPSVFIGKETLVASSVAVRVGICPGELHTDDNRPSNGRLCSANNWETQSLRCSQCLLCSLAMRYRMKRTRNCWRSRHRRATNPRSNCRIDLPHYRPLSSSPAP